MISSRTPDGEPGRCPICGKNLRADPSTVPVRDAPCPHCGCLLWFPKEEAQIVEINRLANEIAQLSERKIAAAEYYSKFLQYLLAAISAPAGAIWIPAPENMFSLQIQINLHQVGLDAGKDSRRRHDGLVAQALEKGQPGLFYPNCTLVSPEGSPAGNPTDYFILLAPIHDRNQVAGLIEVWQDPRPDVFHHRGVLRFMLRMADHASCYLRKTLQ